MSTPVRQSRRVRIREDRKRERTQSLRKRRERAKVVKSSSSSSPEEQASSESEGDNAPTPWVTGDTPVTRVSNFTKVYNSYNNDSGLNCYENDFIDDSEFTIRQTPSKTKKGIIDKRRRIGRPSRGEISARKKSLITESSDSDEVMLNTGPSNKSTPSARRKSGITSSSDSEQEASNSVTRNRILTSNKSTPVTPSTRNKSVILDSTDSEGDTVTTKNFTSTQIQTSNKSTPVTTSCRKKSIISDSTDSEGDTTTSTNPTRSQIHISNKSTCESVSSTRKELFSGNETPDIKSPISHIDAIAAGTLIDITNPLSRKVFKNSTEEPSDSFVSSPGTDHQQTRKPLTRSFLESPSSSDSNKSNQTDKEEEEEGNCQRRIRKRVLLQPDTDDECDITKRTPSSRAQLLVKKKEKVQQNKLYQLKLQRAKQKGEEFDAGEALKEASSSDGGPEEEVEEEESDLDCFIVDDDEDEDEEHF